MNTADSRLEILFEKLLYNCRWFTLLAVLGSLVAAVLMFLKGGVSIVRGGISFFSKMTHFAAVDHGPPEAVMFFISAVDSFLFATVLLIFSMGIYELFVSEIDPLCKEAGPRAIWLRVTSLDDLKSYLGKVILMLLIVNFFEKSFQLKISGPLDLLYMGGGIVLVALSLFLSHGKVHSETKPQEDLTEHSEASSKI